MWFRLISVLCALALSCLPVRAGDGAEKIAALAPKAVVLAIDNAGNELVAQNADQTFVPASVAKLVTAWLALEVLGPHYRFETRFYVGRDRVLHVRGGGDPMLVSEELSLLAPALLMAAGKEPFKGLAVDTGYYPVRITIPGIEDSGEAYDALNSALAVNFNTINARRDGKTVTSAEPQTPITPLAINEFLKRGPKKGRGRISLAHEDPGVAARYAGELIAAFIGEAGGKVDGPVTHGAVPAGLEPVHVHRQSRDLAELLRLLLLGSNNYMANQIFLETGAHARGGPVSLEKSLGIARAKLAAHGLGDEIRLVEGSGISPENRFSPRGLAKVLALLAPHAGLMRATKAGSRYKTGTIDNVSTLAGFARTKKSGDVRFVISAGGGTGKLRFRLLRILEQDF